MEETGVVNVADPLGGSWYVEALTDEIEAEAEEIFARIKDMGADGTMTVGHPARHRGRLVHRRDRRGRVRLPAARWRRATRRSSASTRSTGSVDAHDTLEILRVCHEVETEQKAELAGAPAEPGRRRGRAPPSRGWSRSAAPRRTCAGDARRRPRAEATLGEICDALRAEWGGYTEPAGSDGAPRLTRSRPARRPAEGSPGLGRHLAAVAR